MKIKLKLSLILLVICFVKFADAEISMRKCVILPITDSLDNSMGYKTYSEIEQYLQNSSWCNYRSSSELLGVFKRYRHNLKQHLQDPKVLNVVANKVNAGSLIRVDITPEIRGITISIDIIGDNGEDIYFSEKTLLTSRETSLITQTIINWLELYQKNIPYDGKVIGVLGEQITFDIGRDDKISIGNDFQIKRLKQKKRHPLLKKVVEWETSRVAQGSIFSVSDKQALGQVKLYYGEEKIRSNDWVIVDRTKKPFDDELTKSEKKAYEFGKLGYATMTLDFSNTKSTPVTNNANTSDGLIYGFSLLGELWLTRNYFGMVEFGKRLGSLSGEGTDRDITLTKMKFLFGYKYLPMGYFYGPQVDFYLGLGEYHYDIDLDTVSKLGESKFKGILWGIRGNIPFDKKFRAFGKIEILSFAKMQDSSGLYGGSSNTTNLEFEFGIKYHWDPTFDLHFSLERLSNKASLGGNVASLRQVSNAVKAGIAMNF
jgi:hypothetical protein